MHNKLLGIEGEDFAVTFLKKLGWQILERNWRNKKAELDIIAKDGEILVFVEVKTRSTNYFGPPEWAVTEKKSVCLLMELLLTWKR